MNIVFNITYSTKFGEEVSLNIPVADPTAWYAQPLSR